MSLSYSVVIPLLSAIIGSLLGFLFLKFDQLIKERTLRKDCIRAIDSATRTNLSILESIRKSISGENPDSESLITGFEVSIYQTMLPIIARTKQSSDIVVKIAEAYSILDDFQRLHYEVLRHQMQVNPQIGKSLDSYQGRFVHKSKTRLDSLSKSINKNTSDTDSRSNSN